MIYPYRCNDCDLSEEIIRHHTEPNVSPVCPGCGNPMQRQYTVPRLNLSTQNRVPAGQIELGNEHAAAINTRPPRYDVTDREIQEWSRTTTEFAQLPD